MVKYTMQREPTHNIALYSPGVVLILVGVVLILMSSTFLDWSSTYFGGSKTQGWQNIYVNKIQLAKVYLLKNNWLEAKMWEIYDIYVEFTDR